MNTEISRTPYYLKQTQYRFEIRNNNKTLVRAIEPVVIFWNRNVFNIIIKINVYFGIFVFGKSNTTCPSERRIMIYINERILADINVFRRYAR